MANEHFDVVGKPFGTRRWQCQTIVEPSTIVIDIDVKKLTGMSMERSCTATSEPNNLLPFLLTNFKFPSSHFTPLSFHLFPTIFDQKSSGSVACSLKNDTI
jgi:hypothetical protein